MPTELALAPGAPGGGNARRLSETVDMDFFTKKVCYYKENERNRSIAGRIN